MKIIVCPDSFKGSLSAKEVAECIAEAVSELIPSADILSLPLADGGEGTVEILKDNGILKENCSFEEANGKCIFIESSKHIGLHFFRNEERNPLVNSSKRLGESINNAIKSGYKNIYVSLGGSGTCDGGLGMLTEMGFQFLDEKGQLLEGNGCDLAKVHHIRYSPVKGIHADLKDIRFTVLCDVINPLYGEKGAAYVFAPQKGASLQDLPHLDFGLHNLAEVAFEEGYGNGKESWIPGAGAAGGIGFAMATFLNAEIIRGIDFVLDKLEFSKIIKGADLIITGEGKLDSQSMMGKALSGVLNRAQLHGIPVLAISGKIEDKEILLSHPLLKSIYSIADKSLSLEQNMQKETALRNLRNTLQTIGLTTDNNII